MKEEKDLRTVCMRVMASIIGALRRKQIAVCPPVPEEAQPCPQSFPSPPREAAPAARSQNKSANTITTYLRAANRFVDFLAGQNEPADAEGVGAEGVGAEQVRACLVHEQNERGIPIAVAAHAYLAVFFFWLIEETERSTVSPMLAKDRPKAPSKVRQYVSLEQFGALLEVCRGSDFAVRRDTAIVRMLFDNGMRVSGLCGLRLDDVDLPGRRLRITLKGGNEHWAPIGGAGPGCAGTGRLPGLSCPVVSLEWLWLAVRHHQRLVVNGVQGMLKSRAEAAGVIGPAPAPRSLRPVLADQAAAFRLFRAASRAQRNTPTCAREQDLVRRALTTCLS
ncbi:MULTISPECIES: tyrosine-type recombinase/integrase [unclassified Nonomuraea]|uniref:tyrosine-type recombinase/integrase n=1 Tax=unclassified Nonomuraea TaxID=2593643 RepID=UPI0033D89560